MTGAPDHEDPSPSSRRRRGPDARPLVVALAGTDTHAMERITSELPAGRGMAFIFALACAPASRPLSLEALRQLSSLTVVDVMRPVPLEADHLYLVPPGQRATCRRDVIALEPESRAPPLDHLFRSLAEHHGERSAVLLLTGVRGDGSLGVAEMKASGALVLLQGPANAVDAAQSEHQLLGKSADLVLPLSRMVGALVDYFRPRIDRADGNENSAFAPEALAPILDMLSETTGHDFSRYKHSTVSRRVQRRMRVHGIQEPNRYAELLRSRPAEGELLFNEMLIGVTSFFRDPDSYRVLERALDDHLSRLSPQQDVRVWVPACSTGEEAYSIAILLHECVHRANRNHPIKLFATDIDARAIEFARAGRYPAGISAHVSPERLERYFVQEDDTYRINKETRERIIFAPHNVTRDPPFTHIHLVSCRNLLIYLEPELQQQVLTLFEYALEPGGLLMLGGSESVGALQSSFDLIDKRAKLFVRRAAHPRRTFPLPFDALQSAPAKAEGRAVARAGLRNGPASSAEQLLLSEFVPPSAIVSPSGELAFIHGRTGRFLEPPEGEPTTNVFDMAREGLHLELPAAVRAAHHSQQTVVRRGLNVRTNGSTEPVTIMVKPLDHPEPLRGLLLVTFEVEARTTEPDPTASERTSSLESELHYVRSTLQGMIEDLESSNEELKSMNEELQSTNEEVQSSNEELSTSREELQSLNEELQTLNEELAQRNALLSQSNDDMHNLLSSVQVATVFVDAQLNVKRFTAPARNVFRLRDSDIGRPISDLVVNLDYETLVEDAQEVLNTLVFTEREVQTPNGEWRSVRVQPYRTANNIIDGLIITVTDIQRFKRAEVALIEAQQLFGDVLASLPAPLALLDASLRIIHVSSEFARHFGSNCGDLMAQPLGALGAGWRDPAVERRLAALARGEASPPLRLRGNLGGPVPVDVILYMRRLPARQGLARYLVLTRDVSAPLPPALEIA